MTMTASTTQQLKDEIQALKRETGTIVLAHYYQVTTCKTSATSSATAWASPARQRASLPEQHRVRRVDFMAEVAKILNPSKHVYMPDRAASCPWRTSSAPRTSCRRSSASWSAGRALHQTLAEAKAECDVICTSSNAVEVCQQDGEGKR